MFRIGDGVAFLQVFESTKGLTVGDNVEFSGQLLSVQLGPGLLKQIYDGLQNPLPELAEEHGFFLPRGVEFKPLDEKKKWRFTPEVKTGDVVIAGDALGSVPEGIFDHKIMVPFSLPGEFVVEEIAKAGDYTIVENIARIRDEKGKSHNLTMSFRWPVKIAIESYKEKIVPVDPLVTQARIIDTFFPVAKGGTFCVPGPFGAGKTVLQHVLSRYSQVDIVIVAACGERAGKLWKCYANSRNWKTRARHNLMDRTILSVKHVLCCAAREASVYTAGTMANFFEDGSGCAPDGRLNLPRVTGMRELSGRLEESGESLPRLSESGSQSFMNVPGW